MSALQPLPDGLVLIVGAKASNFSDDIKQHPRVVIWDSQQKHWSNKDLPLNTRAVFMTRFLGHQEFSNIVTEARKRKITIFNPEGTGLIVKQVKELLNMNTQEPASPAPEVTTAAPVLAHRGKLKQLIPYINYTEGNKANAIRLLAKARVMGIPTTETSLAHFVCVQRKKINGITPARMPTLKANAPVSAKLDLSVEIFDNAIKEFAAIREFLIATVDENKILKAKLAKFRSIFED
jgi:hypothetical protein